MTRSSDFYLVARAAWTFNRLRCMSLPEIGHRLRRMGSIQAERWWRRTESVPAPDLSRAAPHWIPAPCGIAPEAYLAEAERIAAGRIDVFALSDVDLGTPPRWNRDPKTGTEAPLAFGKLLNYRDPALVGDIKYLWEPNRHLHLVTLAQAYALSGERRHFEVLRTHLESWFDACPYGLGPNWTSALELAIRLTNWALAWQLLGGADSTLFDDAEGERFRSRWLESIYRHAQFVHGHFSLYSSANNHLIGEASGVFIAALTWPYWEESTLWLDAAGEILEREALAQNAADGVNREQAMSYQQFELDLLLLPMLAAKANGIEFSPGYRRRIELMLEYLASVMDVSGNVPMIGDADDAYLVRLAQEPGFCRYRSLLASGAVLFGRSEFKTKAVRLDDKTRWLFGDAARRGFDALAGADPGTDLLPVRRAFPEGGYWILGCDFETPDEVRLVVDAGPLGYERIAAHGHADALSFTLSVGGFELLIDPGTYAYHTEGEWRGYFRGTSAHNSICIDELDQSQPGGNFIWLHKANAGCRLWRSAPDFDRFEGWHDGYLRLDDPVAHIRRIAFDKRNRCVQIEDVLQMAGSHLVDLHFHCAAQCTVEPHDEGYVLRHGGRCVLLRLPLGYGGMKWQVFRGSLTPRAGWVSHRFDEKLPCTTIRCRARAEGHSIFRSEIVC